MRRNGTTSAIGSLLFWATIELLWSTQLLIHRWWALLRTGPGVLQSATAVAGPYNDLIGATSPYTNTASTPLFFRVRR